MKKALKTQFHYATRVDTNTFRNSENTTKLAEIEGKDLLDGFIYFGSENDRLEFMSSFPKYCKLSKCIVLGVSNFVVRLSLNQAELNNVTGDKNEAFIKRRAKTIEVLKQLGY